MLGWYGEPICNPKAQEAEPGPLREAGELDWSNQHVLHSREKLYLSYVRQKVTKKIYTQSHSHTGRYIRNHTHTQGDTHTITFIHREGGTERGREMWKGGREKQGPAAPLKGPHHPTLVRPRDQS